MAHEDEHGQHERTFTLSEANRLIPQLNSKLTSKISRKPALRPNMAEAVPLDTSTFWVYSKSVRIFRPFKNSASW